MTTSEFKLNSTARLVRKGCAVAVRETREDLDCTEGSESKSLANIGFLHNSYWVYDPAGFEESEDQLALLLRNCAEDGVPGAKLGQGDVIKLGRCKFLVKEIVESAGQAADTKEAEEEKTQDFGKEENKAAAEDTKADAGEKDCEVRCRVCLGEDNAAENPIISSPCNCLGSVKYMHVNCLLKWLKSKVTQKKTDIMSSYVWKEFQCDVCKVDYPGTRCIAAIAVLTQPNGKVIEVFRIEKPQANYMLLEAIKQTASAANSVYIVSSDKRATLSIVKAETRVGKGERERPEDQRHLHIADTRVVASSERLLLSRGQKLQVRNSQGREEAHEAEAGPESAAAGGKNRHVLLSATVLLLLLPRVRIKKRVVTT